MRTRSAKTLRMSCEQHGSDAPERIRADLRSATPLMKEGRDEDDLHLNRVRLLQFEHEEVHVRFVSGPSVAVPLEMATMVVTEG